ncbi:MAG: ribonuclease BN [Novosphingobium sp. 16-62-11]|uniref:YihY/virulence factor BrkB family protein n=1 Tax=Novosphingobium sp. 17-62-19 TaxID=1970406 RepID=UPI000BD04416|nr:YihY/virulence factor BrkB family protein [Novosphingobium sp. 17-62-19]OYX95668.1 MAG: ribonuclease BN [Novosphingobium sp. 35-62-5]OYZ46909.1 MAG: ribonuclease BN [Novosphingobium sp. 16-62-11]OZA18892.1 MAG: ribonuclease BN [Novosphingobium sp. 17-62-19]HQS96230.1 YihY/virulence factor BrkB family protein [Novosphingobium sp.]
MTNLSPEARRQEALRWRQGLAEARERLGPGSRAWEVIKRVFTGVFNDGSIHAGNLAYMIVIAIFPFFIASAALFSLIGEASQRAAAIDAVLIALPPVVAATIEPVARSVIEARSGWLLWIGGMFGLWTVGSLVETIRDILRRAYGTRWEHAFWRYRLASTGVTLASVVLILLAIFAQVLIGAAQEVIEAFLPQFSDLVSSLALSRFIPAAVLYGALWLLFISLTPGAFRGRDYPKWPGALFVTVWWIVVTTALPAALRTFFSYDLTYGSLAGIMIALFFFWLVGLGMVVGAELNAALAETPEERDMLGQADNRARKMTGSGIETNRSENENA